MKLASKSARPSSRPSIPFARNCTTHPWTFGLCNLLTEPTSEATRGAFGSSSPADRLAQPGAAELDRLFGCLDEVTAKSHPRTARLLAAGRRKTAQKVIEEAGEVALEAVKHRLGSVVRESADLLYHLVVLWRRAGVDPDEIWTEMQRRADALGIAEKLPKPTVRHSPARLWSPFSNFRFRHSETGSRTGRDRPIRATISCWPRSCAPCVSRCDGADRRGRRQADGVILRGQEGPPLVSGPHSAPSVLVAILRGLDTTKLYGPWHQAKNIGREETQPLLLVGGKGAGKRLPCVSELLELRCPLRQCVSAVTHSIDRIAVTLIATLIACSC